MCGDYYRYCHLIGLMRRYFAEYTEGDNKDEYSNLSLQSYTKAKEIAEDSLLPTDPVRLGLALNFSVFYYDIRQDPEKACELAKTAFEDAVEEAESLGTEDYKQTKAVLELLRDNLSLWINNEDE